MDSKDKKLADMARKISELEKIIPEKEKQITFLRGSLDEWESKRAGYDAISSNLARERSLVETLNNQIFTLKQETDSQKDQIDRLTRLNVGLQSQLNLKAVI